MATAGAVGR